MKSTDFHKTKDVLQKRLQTQDLKCQKEVDRCCGRFVIIGEREYRQLRKMIDQAFERATQVVDRADQNCEIEGGVYGYLQLVEEFVVHCEKFETFLHLGREMITMYPGLEKNTFHGYMLGQLTQMEINLGQNGERDGEKNAVARFIQDVEQRLKDNLCASSDAAGSEIYHIELGDQRVWIDLQKTRTAIYDMLHALLCGLELLETNCRGKVAKNSLNLVLNKFSMWQSLNPLQAREAVLNPKFLDTNAGRILEALSEIKSLLDSQNKVLMGRAVTEKDIISYKKQYAEQITKYVGKITKTIEDVMCRVGRIGEMQRVENLPIANRVMAILDKSVGGFENDGKEVLGLSYTPKM